MYFTRRQGRKGLDIKANKLFGDTIKVEKGKPLVLITKKLLLASSTTYAVKGRNTISHRLKARSHAKQRTECKKSRPT